VVLTNFSVQKKPLGNKSVLFSSFFTWNEISLTLFLVCYNSQTTSSILEFLRASRPDGELTALDKLRLVLVFFLSVPDNAITKDDIAELEKELKSSGADVSAFEYVRRTREISRMTSSISVTGTSTPSLVGGVAGQGGELFKGFSALGNRLGVCDKFIYFSLSFLSVNPLSSIQLTDRLKDGRFDTLISGVKNFLPTNKLFPVTRLTEALMDSSAASNQSLQETDDYIFLDPRASRHAHAGMPGVAGSSGVSKGKRMAFADGMVFMVGGASYVEYGNLEEWAGKAGKRVTYGGTDIMDPGGFVKVLESLGKVGAV
jgi:sec1 family domain-containing protein 1